MLSKLRAARGAIAALRAALLSCSLDEIGQCLPALVAAAQSLAAVEKAPPDEGEEPGDLRQELEGLRNELRLARQLIEQGSQFYRWWAALLGAATSGYGRSGEAAPLAAQAAALSVRG